MIFTAKIQVFCYFHCFIRLEDGQASCFFKAEKIQSFFIFYHPQTCYYAINNSSKLLRAYGSTPSEVGVDWESGVKITALPSFSFFEDTISGIRLIHHFWDLFSPEHRPSIWSTVVRREHDFFGGGGEVGVGHLSSPLSPFIFAFSLLGSNFWWHNQLL